MTKEEIIKKHSDYRFNLSHHFGVSDVELMMDEYAEQQSILFFEWATEYKSIEGHEFNRYVRKHGMPTVVGPTTKELYDKWINRPIMTQAQALQHVIEGKKITRPRVWAVHRGYLHLENEIVVGTFRNIPVTRPYSEFYSDDAKATDWRIITDSEIQTAP